MVMPCPAEPLESCVGVNDFSNDSISVSYFNKSSHSFLDVCCLGWKHNLLAGHDLGDVEIEEVAVEDSLDHAGHDGDDVVECLVVVAEDPVEDVQTAVGAEGEQVVAGDRLGLPGLGDHEQLGQDGHTLQVDGEGPQDLHHAELVVEDDGEEGGGAEEELDPERVMVAVVGRLELDVHQVDGGAGRADEEKLHGGVVERDEGGEEVKISRAEDR